MEQTHTEQAFLAKKPSFLPFRSVPLHLFIIFLPKLPLCFSHQALINIILMIFLWVQTSIEMYFMRGGKRSPFLKHLSCLKIYVEIRKKPLDGITIEQTKRDHIVFIVPKITIYIFNCILY